MRKIVRIIGLAFATLCFSQFALAQDNRFPLEVIDMTNGPISEKLVREAKENISDSKLFRFAKQGEVRLQLRFQADEIIQPRDGDLAIYSITFTLAHSKAIGDQSAFLTQMVNHCRMDETADKAEDILQQCIKARATLQERIVAILDGKIESLIHTYSAN